MSAPQLTRQQIVDAALERRARDGLASVTLRKLADDLGVSPMGLYRHIRDKDDLLLAIVDVLLSASGSPDPRLPWPDYLTQLAGSLRHLLLADPEIVDVFARQPVTTPAAQDRLAAACAALEAHGLDRTEALRRYATVHTYTIGYCALEKARHIHGRSGPPASTGGGDWAAAIGSFVTESQFHAGLAAIIGGLDATAP